METPPRNPKSQQPYHDCMPDLMKQKMIAEALTLPDKVHDICLVEHNTPLTWRLQCGIEQIINFTWL